LDSFENTHDLLGDRSCYDRRKSPHDAAQRSRYGLSGSTPGAMRRSRYDRRKSPLDAAQRSRYGLRGSTPGAMRRSCYDRRKSPLDAAQRPHYGLGGGALDATFRSSHDRRIGPLDAVRGSRHGLASVKKTLNVVQELLCRLRTETRAKQQHYLTVRFQLGYLRTRRTSFSGSFGH
jgi:hypothetical protein